MSAQKQENTQFYDVIKCSNTLNVFLVSLAELHLAYG